MTSAERPINEIKDRQLRSRRRSVGAPAVSEVVIVAPPQGLKLTDNWQQYGACKAEDPELFFPIGNTGPAISQTEEATSVCRRCNVVEICLKWAVSTGQDSGVWGGMSEDERKAFRRRSARARRAE